MKIEKSPVGMKEDEYGEKHDIYAGIQSPVDISDHIQNTPALFVLT